MKVAATALDGKRRVPVTVDAQDGVLRIVGPHDTNGSAFQGQPRQGWRDRIINWFNLSLRRRKPLRCAFDQVSMEGDVLIIDPGWDDEPLRIEMGGNGEEVLSEWIKGERP